LKKLVIPDMNLNAGGGTISHFRRFSRNEKIWGD